ncbi:unnamed protein product, partial [Mycena citricolor]
QDRRNSSVNHLLRPLPVENWASHRLPFYSTCLVQPGLPTLLKKENELYQKEAVDLQVKKDKMVAENGDEWEIKNAGKMQEETAKMITDSKERLARSFGELRDLVMLAKKEPELVEED